MSITKPEPVARPCCSSGKPNGESLCVTTRGAETLPTFVDATKESGIRFVHENGAFGKKLLPVAFPRDGLSAA